MEFRRLANRCVIALGIVMEQAIHDGDATSQLLDALEDKTLFRAERIRIFRAAFPNKRVPDVGNQPRRAA